MVIVFYASIIPAFLSPEVITIQVALFVAAMLMVIDSFGMIVYCTPVILFRKAISMKFTRYIKLVSGIIIILIGLYIGYTALPASDLKLVF
jgi:threonine/homoserine/homoserine lactone efflux protein